MNQDYKKNAIPHIITLVLGLLLGFFGVFLSVFSDGSIYERMITILIILVIYGILGIVIGIWKPIKTFVFLPGLSMPGVLLLVFYLYKDGLNAFYIPYIILIVAFSYLGLKTGRSFKKKK